MKKCYQCNTVKPRSEFWKNAARRDGLQTQCRTCLGERNKSWHRSEKGRASLRRYRSTPAGQEMTARYRATRNAQEITKAAHEKYRLKNLRKRAAKTAVYHAIKRGEMQRTPCGVCGDPRSQGHHDDYALPLSVRWLCAKHHAEHHRLARGSK